MDFFVEGIEGNVGVVVLGSSENRINPSFLSDFHRCLDSALALNVKVSSSLSFS